MRLSNLRRRFWRGGLVALTVLTGLSVSAVSQVMATDGMHYDGSGREDALQMCSTCHGDDLKGSIIAPSCLACHSDFLPGGQPTAGHHKDGRDDPLNNCAECHGPNLYGDLGPSCFSCHDQLWPGPPVADAGGPYTGFVGMPVSFDGSNSSDPLGEVVAYDWDFGDGATATGANPTHAYADEGLYTVALTVTDNDGLTNTATTLADITVSSNSPPVADPGGPYTGGAGVAVTLDGTNSSDTDGTVVLYSWDFGDGDWGVGPTLDHTYASAGLYTVTLTVTDDGGLTDTATAPVVISDSSNLPPNVDPGGPYTGAPGQPVQFDASGTTDPEGDSLVGFWTFDGDTLPSLGLATTHTWSEPGTYTASVSVTDGINPPVVVDVQVEISNDLPPDDNWIVPGDTWLVVVPFGYGYEEFLLTFQPFFGDMMLAEMTFADGYTSIGIAMESGGVVYWIDGNWNIFIGNIDQETDTMSGIMLSGYASSPWFAERVTWPAAFPGLGP